MEMESGPTRTLPFDGRWFKNVYINNSAVKRSCQFICEEAEHISDKDKVQKLLLAVQCIDLTTLAGDDTHVNVERLCLRALSPFRRHLLEQLKAAGHWSESDGQLTTGAVCVYPSRVSDCSQALQRLKGKPISIASVATGFPSGQYGLETRLKEIDYSIEMGAKEIDVVISRALALAGDWEGLYEEVKRMKAICVKGNAHLKVILGVGELGSLEGVYKASLASMLAGADFIKTSTGKETVNATLPVGLVMTRAIWDFHNATGIKVGFKPAGGLKTARDALQWLNLMETQLGSQWLSPSLFRIGASSLLNDLEKSVFQLIYLRSPNHYEVSL